MINRSIARASMPAFLLAASLAGVARAENAMPPTVSTTGTASVFVAPDRVDLSFSVSSFDPDLAKAKTTGDAAATAVLQFLKDQGVAEAMIRSDFASSRALYDNRIVDGRQVRGPLKGYEVTRSYCVRLDDLSKFATVIDRLLVDPTVSVGGHSFSSKDDRKHRDDARRQAARAAREKAELLAGELGRGVGQARQIDEGSVGSVYPMNRMSNVYSGGGDEGASSEAAPVGQIEIKAEVTVRFDLTDKR